MRITTKLGLSLFRVPTVELRSFEAVPWVALLVCGLLLGNSAAAAEWPRLFENADGTQTIIPTKPQRILSTSVSITGTLLAVKIPVLASATATNGDYFAQWGAVAETAGVEKLWPAGTIDIEAVYAMAPDLIVISKTGADSVFDQKAMLSQIAPTIVLDYSRQSWQQMAEKLGYASGYETQVAETTTEFDRRVAEAKASMRLPKGQANIVSYNGPGTANAISTTNGAHSKLLQQLGFEIEQPSFVGEQFSDQRVDFVRAQYEQLTQLKAETTFLLRAEDDRAAVFMADPVLVNLPSVQAEQVYGLGKHSFRIDYFSAQEIIELMVQRFATEPLAQQ